MDSAEKKRKMNESLIKQREVKKVEGKKRFFHGSWLFRAFFFHLSSIINAGNKKPYSYDMLFKLEDEFLYKDFENFGVFYENNKKKYKNDFFGLILKYCRKYIFIVQVSYILRYGLEMSFPVILKLMLEWIEEENPDMQQGYIIAGMISLALLLRSYVGLIGDYLLELANAKIRNSVRGLIVNKLSNLEPGAKKYVDIGKVANNMMVDINKLCFYVIFRPHLLFVPFCLMFYIYLIYVEIDLLALVVITIFVVCLLGQIIIDDKFKKANLERMEVADQRGRKIAEVISGAKIIKFNAWEKIMNDFIKKLRKKEGSLIFKSFTLYNFSQAVSSLIPTALGLAVFSLYDIINDEQLQNSQIYELVTLFNATLIPVRYYIMAILGRADALAGCERINKLIQITQKQKQENDHRLKKGEIEIVNGNFNWEDPKYCRIFEDKEMDEKKRTTYILKDINLKINQGEFVAVVGKVGSGKSSLVMAMMDELVRQTGEVHKNGNVAYISQESFLKNDTIKDNITFGKIYERKKFADTVKICQMIPDLAIFPGREETEIGERGVNMSGGQKQRINIARAVYSESDIYLIDDALSALDAFVGKKIMEDVFIKKLAGKTRIIVTHYLHLLEAVDKVILIDKGRIVAHGKLENVQKTQAFKEFSSLRNDQRDSFVEDFDPEEEDNMVLSQEENQIEEEIGTQVESILSKENDELVFEETKTLITKEGNEEAGKLTKEEGRETGGVGLKFYGLYMKSAGVGLSLICILFFALSITAKMVCDWWVGVWQDNELDLTNEQYLITYGLMGASVLIFLIFRALTLGFVSEFSAVNVFRKVIWNILRRPMSFFDTTPSGIIINRCTNDVDQLDYLIPWMLSFFLNIIFNFVGALVLSVAVSPISLIFIIIGILIISRSFKRYMKTTIEMKRLVQLSASPMISLSSEFIEGSAVIRNYNKRKDMLSEYEWKSDRHHHAYFHDEVIVTWIRMRVELGLALVVIATIFFVVVDKQYKIMTVTNDSTSGLVISYLLPLSTMTGTLVYPMIILAKAGISIQRLHEYIEWKVHEKPFGYPQAPDRWPEEGKVEVKNLCVRYRKGLPLVLKGVSFNINPGEKVAIIGRTGSGKSTALLTFMRILEIAKNSDGEPLGKILIDGQSIDEIGLHELRGKISIIPQDPFLLEGTLRFNVDPSGRFTDEELVSSLESVSVLETIKMKDIINQRIKKLEKEEEKKLGGMSQDDVIELTKNFKSVQDYIRSTIKIEEDPTVLRLKKEGLTNADKLNLQIEKSGANLSIGQRQLICIARALIKKPKILLMDEATANIDQKTDSIIQNLIKESLDGTSVVTIAHRLITIVQYDKIVILEYGKKVEEGSPKQLLDDDSGYFYGLVGEGGEEFLGKMKMAANDRNLDPAKLFAN